MNAGARLIALPFFALTLLSGCGDPESPEDQVRALIQRAKEAVEERSVSKLREMVSEKYSDERQLDKRGVESVLRYHFLRNQSIHLLTLVKNVSIADDDHVQASVLVAMAGVPILSITEIPVVRADLHHFDVDFVREQDHWRVARANWRRADPAEFLSPVP